MSQSHLPGQLPRELGVFGATMMGLGSMVGVGIFVSIGIAAGISGSGLVIAVVLAGVIAVFNSLNSAQLGVAHPISGGVYEYGYRYLTPWLGFTGGWTYLMARTAAAATAALGFATYLQNAVRWSDRLGVVPLGLLTIVAVTFIVLNGMRQTKVVTTAIVGAMLLAVMVLIVSVTLSWPMDDEGTFWNHFVIANPASWSWLRHTFEASALMFVAFGGYARIATLGEEVEAPHHNIPRAMLWTLAITTVLYGVIAVICLGYLGLDGITNAAVHHIDPLAVIIEGLSFPAIKLVLVFGAITAMLGVLLSSVLGLSRMVLAKARRGDLPKVVARLNAEGTTPHWAVILISGAIALLVLTGDMQTTWSFGAFASLVRCSITNLAALNLKPEERLYPEWIPWVSFVSGLFLMFWLEPTVWLTGSGCIAIGLMWHFTKRQWSQWKPLIRDYYGLVFNHHEKAFAVIWERYQDRFPKP